MPRIRIRGVCFRPNIKRPNLNKRSNRKGRIRSNLNAVQTDTVLPDVRDVCFRSNLKSKNIESNAIRLQGTFALGRMLN